MRHLITIQLLIVIQDRVPIVTQLLIVMRDQTVIRLLIVFRDQIIMELLIVMQIEFHFYWLCEIE